jgi:hypothetical protein
MSADLERYVVTLQSRPGMYAQYGPGDVKVWAIDESDAVEKALRELRRGAFPDRGRDCWKVLGVRRGLDE